MEDEDGAIAARQAERDKLVNDTLDRVLKVINDRPYADARELRPDIEALRPKPVVGESAK